MPELDGIETAKRIRASEAGEPGRRTPILALTANTLVEDRYACFEAGMDGFLIKPLDREKLAEALAGVCRRAASGGAMSNSHQPIERAMVGTRFAAHTKPSTAAAAPPSR